MAHDDSGHSDPTATSRAYGAAPRRVSTETKSALKTTELIAYVATVVGVLLASLIVDAADFGPQEAWRYVTYLTIGYMISRGLAKAGSYEKENDR